MKRNMDGILSTEEKYVLAAMLTTHNSPIVAIDFSTDGRYVRSTCQASRGPTSMSAYDGAHKA